MLSTSLCPRAQATGLGATQTPARVHETGPTSLEYGITIVGSGVQMLPWLHERGSTSLGYRLLGSSDASLDPQSGLHALEPPTSCLGRRLQAVSKA